MQRLYGIFPCNVLSYLREQMDSSPEMRRTFEAVIKPLLASLRMHPELVTGNRGLELSKERWAKREPHDLLHTCSLVALPSPLPPSSASDMSYR